MRSFSNTYIFVFSAVMVVVVATLLSFASLKLQPFQQKNVEIAKKLDILKSVYKGDKVSEAKSKNSYVEKEYDDFITESFVLNSKGDVVDNVDAFEVNLKVELAKKSEDQLLPVFIFNDGNGGFKTIIPVRGKGLWGPIWGYISLDDDYVTIYGAIFDHEGETPGLGAEISTSVFQSQFKGKKIFDGDKFTSVMVEKPGAPASQYAVDAISGGTITSKGLEAMLFDCLNSYELFFKSKMN